MAARIRVYELARELGLTNKEALDLCEALGIGVKSHSSSIEDGQADRVRRKAEREGLTRDVQPDEAEPMAPRRKPIPAAPGSSARPLPPPPGQSRKVPAAVRRSSTTRHFVVDGSNLGGLFDTEERLRGTEAAVAALQEQNPTAKLTWLVDASFYKAIAEKDRTLLDRARAAGRCSALPAHTVDSPDSLILQVAERLAATVVSNDNFEECWGTHPWIRDRGRLVGAIRAQSMWFFPARDLSNALPTKNGPKRREK